MGSELSTKGDVYSYGILLLEMFTGKRPTDEKFKEGLSLHNFVKSALPDRVIEILDPILFEERVQQETLKGKCLRNEIHLQCLNLIYEIGLICSAESPSACLVVRGNDTDQQALLQFKAKITDDQLRVMESWNSSIHFCQWHCVTCGRKHQRVTKLELQSLKLSGSLSPHIGNMSFLRVLNLLNNSFYNQIPQSIGGLRRLETLYLTNNSISGEIPSNLSSCSKLTIVRMAGNRLTGEIPAFLGFLSNLKVLSFYNNSLRGSIPPSLAANAISGTLPVAMFNLSNIRFFDIGENKIQCTLYTDLAITMPYVEFFSVRGNKISGQIPISITNASNLDVLQFNDNRLSGKVPSLEKLDKLSTLQLAVNDLGHGREGDLNFLCTLVNNTKLEFLFISDNNFGGVFPKCVSNFSNTLLRLEIDENKIMGRIPDGIGNLVNLEVLFASENQMSGPIPFEIGRLQKLNKFFAHINFLSGAIPHSIGNLSALTIVSLDFNNLQGNIPPSIGKC
ncbi:probable LRR receptor-like serine/threonine-protein kinase At3g47570 [Gossypium hirsutum]|uniref:Probable LRR receptor-like serine/threonine-protein kinase At3g47570 n=1 Tax=Gossypium hirsutum TaxID=3635 RepID=A0ABM3ASZ9_GOSHI|nr:probable LRR receptor-like serine/threonine-protein kinase At3g47570 [Gossypium hirsutum]